MSFEGTLLSLSELCSALQNFRDLIIINILKMDNVSIISLPSFPMRVFSHFLQYRQRKGKKWKKNWIIKFLRERTPS